MERPEPIKVGIRSHERASTPKLRRIPPFRSESYELESATAVWQTLSFAVRHPIGPYVVDFYCPSSRLVVELDGKSHDDRGERDQERQRYLESVLGLRVLRVTHDDVMHDQESVVFGLLKALGIEIESDTAGRRFRRTPPPLPTRTLLRRTY